MHDSFFCLVTLFLFRSRQSSAINIGWLKRNIKLVNLLIFKMIYKLNFFSFFLQFAGFLFLPGYFVLVPFSPISPINIGWLKRNIKQYNLRIFKMIYKLNLFIFILQFAQFFFFPGYLVLVPFLPI